MYYSNNVEGISARDSSDLWFFVIIAVGGGVIGCFIGVGVQGHILNKKLDECYEKLRATGRYAWSATSSSPCPRNSQLYIY